MKKGIIYLMLFGLAVSVISCSGDNRKPSLVYMPDMYYPVAYDPYMEADFEYWPQRKDKESEVPLFADHDNMTALWPAQGTVAQTDEQMILPWELKNTLADYDKSVAITQSPLNPDNRAADLERGKMLYQQTCTVCHGDTGDGQGSIVKTKAYSGVPTYKERNISVGSVYHVIIYGKNAMGSYAPQLNPIDRWRVAEYVMQLRAESMGETAPAPAEESTEENTEQN